MTQSDYYPVTRSLAYLALVVPDLPAAIDEAQEINGLHLIGRSSDTAYLTSGERAFELLLRSGSGAGVQRIGLEATNEDSFRLLKSRLKDVDFRSFAEVLSCHGFSGPAVIEQDRKPGSGEAATAEMLESLRYLSSLGINR
jgi:hypothetical protein